MHSASAVVIYRAQQKHRILCPDTRRRYSKFYAISAGFHLLKVESLLAGKKYFILHSLLTDVVIHTPSDEKRVFIDESLIFRRLA